MLKYGANNIGKIFLGSNEIGKAFLGSNLVFQKDGGGDQPGGDLPAGYVAYDYIEADATAIIDTGVNASSPLSMWMRFVYPYGTTGDVIPLGARGAGNTNTRMFPLAIYQQRINFGYGFYQTVTDSSFETSLSNGYHFNVWTSLANGAQTRRVLIEETNVEYEMSFSLSGDFNLGKNLHLFANNYTSISHVKAGFRCYGLRLYDDAVFSSIIFDGIPCTNQYGEAGLYDKIGKQFHGKIGGGSITAGND